MIWTHMTDIENHSWELISLIIYNNRGRQSFNSLAYNNHIVDTAQT